MKVAQMRKLHEEMERVLQGVAKAHGVVITSHGARGQGGLETVFKFRVNETSVDGKTQGQQNWETFAQMYGMEPEWFGKVIQLNGKAYTISGLLTNRPKNCVEITNEANGKRYITNAATVKRQMQGPSVLS